MVKLDYNFKGKQKTPRKTLDEVMEEQEALEEDDPEVVIDYKPEIIEQMNTAINHAFNYNDFNEVFRLILEEDIDVNFQVDSNKIQKLLLPL